MPDANSRLVYSTDGTDGGRVRPPVTPRGSSQAAPRPADPRDGYVRVRREKKGRGGKTVTVVSGIEGTAADLDRWLKLLKAHCGAGGTRDGDVLVIQGDHRDRVQARLEEGGLRVKQAGG
ncbi:MAG: translation initiation factor [Dehalococcoidia bacterium]|nr:translation initiation factor [Dehalococcoidia bacterium]